MIHVWSFTRPLAKDDPLSPDNGPQSGILIHTMEFDLSQKTSRRIMVASLPSSFGLPLLAAQNAAAQSQVIKSFRVAVPESKLKHILRRVRETRWPDRLDASDWRYGANWDYMRALAEYWTTRFDWRKAEANLNRYPQYLARVDD